jgi:hypothetical protein
MDKAPVGLLRDRLDIFAPKAVWGVASRSEVGASDLDDVARQRDECAIGQKTALNCRAGPGNGVPGKFVPELAFSG